MEGRKRTSEFAPLAWQDNPIHGLRLEIGDADAGNWRSDLVLDIDHIVSWACGTETPFLVAPAILTFHHAGDLRLAVDCGDTGGQVTLHEFSIDRISREPVRNQKVCLDRPYYRWRIDLNWPKGGVIAFAASGFTLALRAEPALLPRPLFLNAANSGTAQQPIGR